MTKENPINHEEIEQNLAKVKTKLEKVFVKHTDIPAGRRGAKTTVISAGRYWTVTSLLWNETVDGQHRYVNKGKAIMVKRPSSSANPTARALASQKLVLVTEAAFEGSFTKTIKI